MSDVASAVLRLALGCLVLAMGFALLIAVVALAGAVAALVGSFGLLSLRSFFQRVHAPTLASTVGTWSIALATALQQSLVRDQVFVHALLVPAFVAVTAPITTIFLMRAATFRRRVAGEDAPPPLG
jgi:multicomponent K+:H+ antiporter subunit G